MLSIICHVLKLSLLYYCIHHAEQAGFETLGWANVSLMLGLKPKCLVRRQTKCSIRIQALSSYLVNFELPVSTQRQLAPTSAIQREVGSGAIPAPACELGSSSIPAPLIFSMHLLTQSHPAPKSANPAPFQRQLVKLAPAPSQRHFRVILAPFNTASFSAIPVPTCDLGSSSIPAPF